MNRKYRHILIVMAFNFIIFIMTGCSIRGINLPAITEMDPSAFIQEDYFVIDNESPLNELLLQEYTLSQLDIFFGKHSVQGAGMLKDMGEAKRHTWDEVNALFPVRCLRYHSNVHYSVYKVKEGGYYYVFWSVPFATIINSEQMNQEKTIETFASVYISKLATISSFNSIIKNFSTAKDILMIDSQMELNFFSSAVTSYSRLKDGRTIIVEYSHSNLEEMKDLVVKDIMVCSETVAGSKISAINERDLP